MEEPTGRTAGSLSVASDAPHADPDAGTNHSAARRFGPYELVQPLPTNGVGEAYRARDVRRDRWVALRILPPSYGADPDAMGRLRERMEAVAGLDHPHLLPVHRFGKIGRRPYVETRLVEGADLGTLLQRHGAWEPSRAVHLTSQLADALDALHAAGVVHGDVSPRTVVVAGEDGRGDAYLTDAAIAAPVGLTQTSLTVTGEAPGRLDCVAPERLTGRALDRRADVYSLACVLVTCLTGRGPYGVDDLPSLVHACLYADPPTLAGTVDGVPPALDAVVGRALAKRPDDRFASAGEFAAEVRRAMGVSAPVPPPRVAPADRGAPAPPPLMRAGAPFAARIAVAVITILVIASALAFLVRNRAGDPEQAGTSPAGDPSSVSDGAASDTGASADAKEGPEASGHAGAHEDDTGTDEEDTGTDVVPSLAEPTAGRAIAVGQQPHEIAIAPDGRTAYIADPAAGAVFVLDTDTRSVKETIPIPQGPPQMVSLSPDGSQAYVSIFAESMSTDYSKKYSKNFIGIVDTATGTVVDTVPVGRGPYAADPSPNGRLLYVPLFDEPYVEVVDLTTAAVVDRITGAPNPHWIDFTEDGRFGYTANHFSDVVTVVDLFSHTVVDTVPVGDAPHSVETSPDGKHVAVVTYMGNEVSIIDAASNEVVRTVPVGAGPQDVTYAPDGRHLYTANVDDGTVSVVDTATGKETARIPTGASPTSVEVLPDGRTAFVTNFDDGTVRPLTTGAAG